MLRWIKRKLFSVNAEGKMVVDHDKRVLQMQDKDGNWIDVPSFDEHWYWENNKQHKFVGTPAEWKRMKASLQTRKPILPQTEAT